MKPNILILLLMLSLGHLDAAFFTELNGFQLWQLSSVPKHVLGKPFKTQEDNTSKYEMYALKPHGYMVFEYSKTFPENIFSIQITADVKGMLPFQGLVLGDPKEKVLRRLGKPDFTKSLIDPPVDAYYFDTINTSVEFDKQDHLYSIRIRITNPMMQEKQSEFEDVKRLFEAVRKKDIETIIELCRPDVEIYTKDETLSIGTKISDFRQNPDPKFVDAFIGETNSLYEALKESSPDAQIRMSEYVGIGQVHKFYQGSIIKELVLFPYGGTYKVYEMRFYTNKPQH